MDITTKEGQVGEGGKYPSAIKNTVIASIVNNPDNPEECFLIPPKDYVPGWVYQDYINAGFKNPTDKGNKAQPS